MKKSQTSPTTARRLEEWSAEETRHGSLRRKGSGRALREAAEIQKFNRGEDVLDYFDVFKAHVFTPQPKTSAGKSKFTYPTKRNFGRRAARDIDGKTDRSNGVFGKSDIEGKAAMVAASELGSERVSNEREHLSQSW